MPSSFIQLKYPLFKSWCEDHQLGTGVHPPAPLQPEQWACGDGWGSTRTAVRHTQQQRGAALRDEKQVLHCRNEMEQLSATGRDCSPCSSWACDGDKHQFRGFPEGPGRERRHHM
ncbi:uncharacterized protein WM294_001650 isoform 1-T1 [Sarcoramphus papa]